MQARTTLLGWLRGDRGEADPIAVVAGTVVYLLASVLVAGSVTLALGASTQAQGNTQLTQKVEAYVAQWQSKDWGQFASLSAPSKNTGTGNYDPKQKDSPVPASAGFTGTQREYKDSIGTVHLTVAAGRAHGLAAVSNCSTVFKTIASDASPTVVDANAQASTNAQDSTCMVLQGAVTASPFDKTPTALPGITPVVTKAGRGVNIATIDIDTVKQSDNIDLRVNVKPTGVSAADKAQMWLSLTCDDTTKFADYPDSKMVDVDGTWMTGRVTLSGVDSYDATKVALCPKPTLRLFTDVTGAGLQVANIAPTNVYIWRVAGAAQ